MWGEALYRPGRGLCARRAETARAQLGNTASKMKKKQYRIVLQGREILGEKFVGAPRQLHGSAQPR